MLRGQVFVDLEQVREGSLEDDWDIAPPKQIKVAGGPGCGCAWVCAGFCMLWGGCCACWCVHVCGGDGGKTWFRHHNYVLA